MNKNSLQGREDISKTCFCEQGLKMCVTAVVDWLESKIPLLKSRKTLTFISEPNTQASSTCKDVH
jgi:hypothetical protein